MPHGGGRTLRQWLELTLAGIIHNFPFRIPDSFLMRVPIALSQRT
jgi:hypothetical protein